MIKCKGWDTIRRKMYSAEEMGKDELTLNPNGRGFVNVSSIGQKLSQYMPHIIPIPFTGLFDMNKEEIYIGDILKYSFKTKSTLSYPPITVIDPGFEIWEIKYIAPSFVYVIHLQNNSYYGKLPSTPRNISLNRLGKSEIIGNIYENPDKLLYV